MSQEQMFNTLTCASMARDGSPAIGIDLGTTFSCAAVYRHGAPEIIPNDQGNRITPSCVSFDDNQRLIGDGARNQAAINPTNTVFDAKRLIGRTYNDPCVQSDVKLWPFRVTCGPNGKPTIVVRHRNEEKKFVAEEISAMVLTKMKECAEAFLGCDVSRAVVTVPNYFNDSQRQATKDAATIAGLDVLQILNEPTAAAVLYGIENKRGGREGRRRALIFDLGGGTFDVSLVEVDETGRVEVIATDGDTHLGGEDFDNRMVYHFMEVFRRKNNGANLGENPKSMRRLRTACEGAKRILSSREGKMTPVQVEALYNGIDFNETITRAKFEELNRDLFHKCMEIVRRLLTGAKVEKGSIEDVVLVGGSSRILRIEVLLRELFPMSEIRKSMNPDESVAMGAAIRAAHLSGQYNRGTELLKNVTPLSLGLNVRGGLTYVLIPRNTQVPCQKKHMFATSEDFQTQVRFRVYEGERADSELNNLLGEFYVNVRRERKGVVKLDVVFSVDEDGILTVSSEEVDVGRKVEVTITNESGRLRSEEIERMVNDARNFKFQDEERRRAVDAMNKLEEYVLEIETKIGDGSDVSSKLKAAERKSLRSMIEKTRQWCTACPAARPYEIENKKNTMRMVWEPLRIRLTEGGVFP